MCLNTLHFQLPITNTATCRGNCIQYTTFKRKGNIMLLCSFNKITTADVPGMTCIFFIAGKINCYGYIVEKFLLMQGFQCSYDQHISTLHINHSLAGGSAIGQHGKWIGWHIRFKNRIEVSDQEKFFSFLTFSISNEMPRSLHGIRQIDPLHCKT